MTEDTHLWLNSCNTGLGIVSYCENIQPSITRQSALDFAILCYYEDSRFSVD